ncbi:MAG: transglutaminase domain-containing protein, partial [bacterium]|nr:transglutaminase domain-containing protein [bacterium]
MRLIHKQLSQLICILLIVCILFSSNFGIVNAAITSNPTTTQVESLTSSENFNDEYFTVRTPMDEDNIIYVEGKTKILTKRFCIRLRNINSGESVITTFVTPDQFGEFSIKINTAPGNTAVPQVINSKGTVTQIEDSYGTTPGYRPVSQLPEGYYRLIITRAITDEDADVSRGSSWYTGSLSGSNGYVWRDAVLQITGSNNNPKLVKYDSVFSNNVSIRSTYEPNETNISDYTGSYVRYLDPYMREIDFVFNDPITKESRPMTQEMVDYVASVAAEITTDANSSYDKLLKIYEYVASNYYYDNLAFEKDSCQYAHPYDNLYNLRNKVTSLNSIDGKVATVCQGYAMIVVSLARALGIPARVVNGRHIETSEVWDSVDDYSLVSHWWCEAYVDGRWIVIDANMGSPAHWNRTSFNDPGTWSRDSFISYAGFDTDLETMAGSYCYVNIYQGSKEREFACIDNEISQLRSFLNYENNGISNGLKMNVLYTPNDLRTWGPEEDKCLRTDGYGKIRQIIWNSIENRLYGTITLNGFQALEYLSLYNNIISEVDIADCPALNYLHASNNIISTFDGTGAPSLKTIVLTGNPLTNVSLNVNDSIIKIRNTEGGTFGFEYKAGNPKVLTISVTDVSKGYRFAGIFNENGDCLSTEDSYSFNPIENSYIVAFELTNPYAPIVKATHDEEGYTQLSWSKLSEAVSYDIYRAGYKDGPYTLIDSINNTTWIDSTAKPDVGYHYKVRAIYSSNSAVEYADSESVFSISEPIVSKLDSPVLTASYRSTTGSTFLRWNSIQNAKEYNIYRSMNETGDYEKIATVSGLSLDDTTAT